eukprot:1704664-Amphidinium_carterae.1
MYRFTRETQKRCQQEFYNFGMCVQYFSLNHSMPLAILCKSSGRYGQVWAVRGVGRCNAFSVCRRTTDARGANASPPVARHKISTESGEPFGGCRWFGGSQHYFHPKHFV